MFGLGKKKIEEPVGASVAAPINPANSVSEPGKEVQFKDNNTGEYIYQRALSLDQRRFCAQVMQENGQLANKFIILNRQRIDLEKGIVECMTAIVESEKRINDTVEKIRDEQKLDRRWGLNMGLGVLERRDPPNG